jgi:phosphoglycerate dehydrogenase-like enzyme
MASCYAPSDFDVRDDHGVPTGETITVRPYVGWTTDEAKANAAREAGATIREYRSKDPQFSGWEVSVRDAV